MMQPPFRKKEAIAICISAVDDARRGMETLWPALALQLVYMTRALHLEMLLKVLYKDIRN